MMFGDEVACHDQGSFLQEGKARWDVMGGLVGEASNLSFNCFSDNLIIRTLMRFYQWLIIY